MIHSFEESNKKFLLLQGSLGQSSHINFQLGVSRDFLKSMGNGILPTTPEVSSEEVNSRSFQSLWEGLAPCRAARSKCEEVSELL